MADREPEPELDEPPAKKRSGRGRKRTPPRECVNCKTMTKPTRQGRCNACYTYLLRNGIDRIKFIVRGPAGPRAERTPREIAHFERELVEKVFKELGINAL